MNVGQIASDHSCFDEWDEEYECHVLNEDLLLDEMEPMMHPGGKCGDDNEIHRSWEQYPYCKGVHEY